MSTIEFIDHLTTIFLDIVLPALILWIGFMMKSWMSRFDSIKVEAHAHAQPAVDYPPTEGKKK